MEEWWKEQEAREERKKRQQQRKQESDAHLQELLPLPQRSEPQDWEDLPSLLSRVGRSMNYENARWVLHPQHVSRGIAPAALPRLHLRADYLLLTRLLHLEEEQIYQLTLHRFASRFEQTPAPLSQQMATTLVHSSFALIPLLPCARVALTKASTMIVSTGAVGFFWCTSVRSATTPSLASALHRQCVPPAKRAIIGRLSCLSRKKIAG